MRAASKDVVTIIVATDDDCQMHAQLAPGPGIQPHSHTPELAFTCSAVTGVKPLFLGWNPTSTFSPGLGSYRRANICQRRVHTQAQDTM